MWWQRVLAGTVLCLACLALQVIAEQGYIVNLTIDLDQEKYSPEDLSGENPQMLCSYVERATFLMLQQGGLASSMKPSASKDSIWCSLLSSNTLGMQISFVMSSESDRQRFLNEVLAQRVDWWAATSGVLCGPSTRVYAGFGDYPRITQFGCHLPGITHSAPLCCESGSAATSTSASGSRTGASTYSTRASHLMSGRGEASRLLLPETGGAGSGVLGGQQLPVVALAAVAVVLLVVMAMRSMSRGSAAAYKRY